MDAKKKNGCGCLAIILIPILIIFFWMMSSGKEHLKELYTPTGTQVEVVFDGDKYSNISSDDLRKNWGKPKYINKLIDSTYKVEMYTYFKKDYMYEVFVYDDSVVKIRIYPEKDISFKKIDSYDTFATLGVTPTKEIYQSVFAPLRYKFSDVSKKVFSVDIVVDKNKNVSIATIVYDKRFDTPRK